MPIAKINGIDINYEIVGDEGPAVTLITGGRRGYAEFLPLARMIAEQGFRVFLHDRRNTGASSSCARRSSARITRRSRPPGATWQAC